MPKIDYDALLHLKDPRPRCAKPYLNAWTGNQETCARPWGHSGGCDS